MPGTPMHLEALFGLRRVVVPTGAGMVTLRVGREGRGAATVLLHGAAGSWTTWLPLLAAADRAGTPLRNLVLVDLPGWGESPGPVPGPAGLARAVADVVRAAGFSRWAIVGHSLGGAVALDVAARFPAETVSVGLVSPSGVGVWDAVVHPFRGGLRLPAFAGMLLAMRLLRLVGPASGPFLRVLRRIGALWLLAAPLFGSRVDRWVTDALADEIRPASFVAAATGAREVDAERWRGIRVPVRSVRGRRDVFARRDDDAHLARLVPDVGVRVLPDAGHFAHVEHPADTLEALADVWAAAAPHPVGAAGAPHPVGSAGAPHPFVSQVNRVDPQAAHAE